MAMSVNGDVVSEGTGAACLGNPLHAATWLADVLCERGIPLQPGDVLMTGALGPMHDLAVGDEVDLDFGPLGRVTTRLAE
jgi:2-keto-4-pentenoate hydratase